MGQVNGCLGIIMATQHLPNETVLQRFDLKTIAIEGQDVCA